MNSKASNVAPGTSVADIGKFAAAALVAIAGIASFYLLPTWPAPLRALLVAAAFAGAIFVASLTAVGHRGRDFPASRPYSRGTDVAAAVPAA